MCSKRLNFDVFLSVQYHMLLCLKVMRINHKCLSFSKVMNTILSFLKAIRNQLV